MRCTITNVESFELSHIHFHAQSASLDQADGFGAGLGDTLSKSLKRFISERVVRLRHVQSTRHLTWTSPSVADVESDKSDVVSHVESTEVVCA